MSKLKVDSIENLAGDSRFGPVLGTPVAAAGQTSIDFTGIPSWAKKATVHFMGFSTSGTSAIAIRIGGSGGVATTGYVGQTTYLNGDTNANNAALSSAFALGPAANAAAVYSGQMTLGLSDSASNVWTCSGVVGDGVGSTLHTGGYKNLSALLTTVRITTIGGVNTFDAGSVNVVWE